MRRLPPRHHSFPQAVTRGSDSSAGPSVVDKVLHRVANFSQLGLLALGVFGYFYTVVPVFQNQQLQEQAAKLELEKADAVRQLAFLVSQQNKVSSEIERLQVEWSREKARNSKLVESAALASQREVTAQRSSEQAQEALRRQLTAIDVARWELVMVDWSFAYYFGRLNRGRDLYETTDERRPGAFILGADKEWPRPHEDLQVAIDIAEKRGAAARDIPTSFYEELRTRVSEGRNDVACTRPDLTVMHAEYLVEFQEIDQKVEAELQDYVAKLRADFAAKNQRVEINDEFTSTSRRRIRIGKAFELDKRYREKISDMRKKCEERGDRLFEAIKTAKEVKR